MFKTQTSEEGGNERWDGWIEEGIFSMPRQNFKKFKGVQGVQTLASSQRSMKFDLSNLGESADKTVDFYLSICILFLAPRSRTIVVGQHLKPPSSPTTKPLRCSINENTAHLSTASS